MKKVALLVFAFAIVSSYGALQVQWSGADGFVRADGTTPLADGFTPGEEVYLAQLIFSPSGVISPAFLGGTATGDNQVLQNVNILASGDEYGPLNAQNFTGPFSAGQVFVRVFDVGSTNPGDITAGMFYYDGPLVTGVDQSDDLSVFQPYNANTGTAGFAGFNTDVLNQQVIPEPSVFAMLGLGGLVLMIRRRFVNA